MKDILNLEYENIKLDNGHLKLKIEQRSSLKTVIYSNATIACRACMRDLIRYDKELFICGILLNYLSGGY